MNDVLPRVVLVTGASSGIGAACARRLEAEGYRVYGTSRRAFGESNDGVQMLQVDVASDASVQEAVARVLEREGRIDALVNNAGYGLTGAVEHTSIEEAKALFDVNFFGYVRMARAVLPDMRRRRRGLVVNVGSLGGLIGLPFQATYSATKFALEGWAEGLALEVAQDGINVVVVEPSDMATGFTRNRQVAAEMAKHSTDPLAQRTLDVMAIVERDESGGPSPEQVAACISKIFRTRSPRLRYRVGSFVQCHSATLRSWLPQWAFQWVIGSYYGLGRTDRGGARVASRRSGGAVQ